MIKASEARASGSLVLTTNSDSLLSYLEVGMSTSGVPYMDEKDISLGPNNGGWDNLPDSFSFLRCGAQKLVDSEFLYMRIWFTSLKIARLLVPLWWLIHATMMALFDYTQIGCLFRSRVQCCRDNLTALSSRMMKSFVSSLSGQGLENSFPAW